VAEVAARLHKALEPSFRCAASPWTLEASIGVALRPTTATTSPRSCAAPTSRCTRPSARGPASRPTRRARSLFPERLSLLAELRRALDEDELVLHYQPKISLGSGAVIGVEALVRWQHPQRGLLGPGEFVPLAERTGMVAALTRWVLDTAVRQCAAWRAAGLDLPVP
jgi:predicted signal transduction protein with EAL and GGDEF domain